MKLSATLLVVVMGLICISSCSEVLHHDGLKRRRPGGANFKTSSVKRRSANSQTFSQSLFENSISQRIRQAVLQTQFFQKMESNSLPPEQYGGFMVQDAAYLFHSIKSFDRAAAVIENRTLDPDFALFYRTQSDEYRDYTVNNFVNKWHVKKPGCVLLGAAAKTYVEYERNLAEQDPKFLSIGILPCLMLWPWVARQIDNLVPQDGVYRSWVTDNSATEPYEGELFVDVKFADSDQSEKEKCQQIFNQGMINELNFFRSACGEKLKRYGDFDSGKNRH